MDAAWGDRYGLLLDPSGYFWGVATHKEDVAPEEIVERLKAEMAKVRLTPDLKDSLTRE